MCTIAAISRLMCTNFEALSTIIISMHKFMKFLIAKSIWFYSRRHRESDSSYRLLRELFIASISILWIFSSFVSLGAHQSASDANKLIIRMMSVRDGIFLVPFAWKFLDVSHEDELTSTTRRHLWRYCRSTPRGKTSELQSAPTRSFNWKMVSDPSGLIIIFVPHACLLFD